MKTFAGRVAAITGASSGIGRALALELAARGCNLALCSHSNQDGLQETAALARRRGVKVSHSQVDVAQLGQVRDWARSVVREHGCVNLLINNAGVAHAGNVADTDYADYEWLMGINYWGVIYGSKEFLPYMVASGEGHIVNISSVFGLFAPPGMSAYSSSKFAVRGFTEALRQELELSGSCVSATCVHPGGVKTGIAKAARTSGSAVDPLKGVEKLLQASAGDAARAILAGVRRNARRVLIGADARAADGVQRLLPAAYQGLVTGGLRVAGSFRPRPR
ncbi:SDR family NAD(P)-dependent oxidoreductase [Solimonas sp. K1W22B-7]|uniref:SDR family NAD(P)-dependent oxidoreductase n=1 Tax=Solimonas sp. K1W22B-7 TaxID=2303331 RepID=UPI000E33586F|nr:SDR family NAD(P)-dependent oxidoreductase [Solimonas sp. K1W22B-7]AXQ30511.1 SDR family NAD(P)-dependent oxidoreductase [Solimonas sp. K1W22B-7]